MLVEDEEHQEDEEDLVVVSELQEVVGSVEVAAVVHQEVASAVVVDEVAHQEAVAEDRIKAFNDKAHHEAWRMCVSAFFLAGRLRRIRLELVVYHQSVRRSVALHI